LFSTCFGLFTHPKHQEPLRITGHIEDPIIPGEIQGKVTIEEETRDKAVSKAIHSFTEEVGITKEENISVLVVEENGQESS